MKMVVGGRGGGVGGESHPLNVKREVATGLHSG